MTDLDLTKLRALAEAAWGEWRSGAADVGKPHEPWLVYVTHDGIESVLCEMETRRVGYSANARFIAAARQGVPALLDRVEELQRECERLRALHEGLRVEVERWETRWALDMGGAIADRDAYRAMLADLLAVQDSRRLASVLEVQDRARDLLKHGPTAKGANDE